MKIQVSNYTFDASEQTVTFTDITPIVLERVLLVVNATDNIIIFNFADNAKGGTASTNVLTLMYDTTSMADADDLLIYYEDGEQGATEGTLDDIKTAVEGTVTVDTGLTQPLTDTELRADPVVVDLGANNDVTVTGTVTANLSGTDNAVLDDIAADTEAIKTAVEGTLTVTGGGGGTQYTEGDTDASLTGTVALAEGPSSTATPLQVDASKNLQVDIAADSASLATTAKQDTIIGHLDGVEGVLATIDADTGTLAGAVDGTEVQVDVLTMPTTTVQATNLDIRDLSSASDSVAIGGTVAVTQSGTWDEVGINDSGNSITVDNGGTFAVQVSSALPAGTNAIGKLSANSGVDIGDVDVTSLPSIPAGNNNIGDVDVASLPALAAGTNNIGDVDVLSLPRSQSGPGQPGTAVDSYTHASINLAAGNNQVLVSSAANKQIWVYGIGFTVNSAGSVSFQDEDDTAITGVMPFATNSGLAIAPSGNFSMPIWKLATDKDLEVDIVTSEVDGWIDYAIVSV